MAETDNFRGSLQRQEVEALNSILSALTAMSTTQASSLTALQAIEAALEALVPTSQVYTVATLPTSPAKGYRAFVTDSNTTTFNATPGGGGANNVPVFFNGTVWRVG